MLWTDIRKYTWNILSQQKEQKANMHKKDGERKAEYLLHKANLHNNQSINLYIKILTYIYKHVTLQNSICHIHCIRGVSKHSKITIIRVIIQNNKKLISFLVLRGNFCIARFKLYLYIYYFEEIYN